MIWLGWLPSLLDVLIMLAQYDATISCKGSGSMICHLVTVIMIMIVLMSMLSLWKLVHAVVHKVVVVTSCVTIFRWYAPWLCAGF